MNKLIWIWNTNNVQLTLDRISADILYMSDGRSYIANDTLYTSDGHSYPFDKTLLLGPNGENYRLAIKSLWDIRVSWNYQLPPNFRWENHIKKLTAATISEPTTYDFLLQCFDPIELTDLTWYISFLLEIDKLEKPHQKIKTKILFKKMISIGALDNKIEPRKKSKPYFSNKAWKKHLTRPVGIIWNNKTPNSLMFIANVYLQSLIVFDSNRIKNWHSNKYDKYIHYETNNIQQITTNKSGFHLFLINAEYYVDAKSNDNLYTELNIISNLNLNQFMLPEPSFETKKIFLNRSFIAYLQIPTQVQLTLSKNSNQILITVTPDTFSIVDTPTVLYYPDWHDQIIDNPSFFVSKRGERCNNLNRKEYYTTYLYIVNNHTSLNESPNSFYDYIYHLLPEAEINKDNEYWPPETKYEFPFDWQKKFSAFYFLTKEFIQNITKPVIWKVDKRMQLPPIERTNRRNPYLKPPLHTNVLIAANNEPTVTFTTILRERPETNETPFDKFIPKTFEKTTLKELKNIRLNFSSSGITRTKKNRLGILKHRKIILPLQHPFLKINENGKFPEYLTTNNFHKPIEFNFLTDGKSTYKKSDIENSKKLKVEIFNNCLVELYKHLYLTFDFSKAISFSNQDSSVRDYNTSKKKIKWKLLDDGTNSLYFFINNKLLHKKAWIKYILFYFFEPSVSASEFNNIISQIQKALKLPRISEVITNPKKSWGNFLSRYWYIKYALINLFSDRLKPITNLTPDNWKISANVLPLFSKILSRDEKNIWLNMANPLGSQLFLLIEHLGKEINFQFDDNEPFNFVPFLEHFIAIYLNDYVLLSNLNNFKQFHWLLEDVTNTKFDIANSTEIEYFYYIKNTLLPYIFNLVLTEGVHFFKLEREVYLHTLKADEKAEETLKRITNNPWEYLLSYGKKHKNKIKLPLHSLPIRGRKPIKKKTWLKIAPSHFEPEYTTAPFLHLWKNKNLVLTPTIFKDYQTNYQKLESILLSLRTKLFLSNVSTHMINPFYYNYLAYTQAFELNKIIEYPTYPWVQCTKQTLLKYLILYYVESLPKIWYKKNKIFLNSLWQTGILKLDNLKNKKTHNLKLILYIYIYETTFSSTDTEFQNSFIFRQFHKWKSYKHHYGENEIIKQFMISIITDEFIRYNLAECTELWELSNLLKGKPSRYFKYGDKWLEPELGGVGYFYPGKFIRLCRAQLANYLYHDFLKMIASDNRDIFSKYTRFPFLGALDCYHPDYFLSKSEKFSLNNSNLNLNMLSTKLWDSVNKIQVTELIKLTQNNSSYRILFDNKTNKLNLLPSNPTYIPQIDSTLTAFKSYKRRKIKIFKSGKNKSVKNVKNV